MKTDLRVLESVASDRYERIYPRRSLLDRTQAGRCLHMALVLGTSILLACSLRTGAPSRVADVCQMDEGTFVTVDGFLQLPNFLEAEVDPEDEVTIYALFLSEEPGAKSPVITTLVSGTRVNKINRIAELPSDGYTQRDLQIFTASGETVSSSDRVRISGELRKGNRREQPCILTTEKIERP